ncbi:MAG: DUF4013 domain-containing protein [Syntrophomonadaceae bacterium]
MQIQEFIKYPFKDPLWFKTFLLGCMVTVLPGLNIITLGYFVNCIELGYRGKQALPGWDSWGEHFRNGAHAFIIILAYLLIPAGLFPILIRLDIIGVYALLLIILAVGWFIPLALVNYTTTLILRDGFQFNTIFLNGLKIFKEYSPVFIYMFFISAIATGIVFAIPYLSFLGVMLFFYSGVVFFNYVGQLHKGL